MAKTRRGGEKKARRRRSASLEERAAAIASGRKTSARRLAESLAALRRADRIDLLERIAAGGSKVLERCLGAALGSTARHVLARNEGRREVFVRFVATSADSTFLEGVRDALAARWSDDAAAIEIVARRIEALGPALPEPAERTLRLVAEGRAGKAIGALLSVATEVDLLAREADARDGIPRPVAYRVRRARETLRTELGRLGVVAFGEPGEAVPFDARRHQYIGVAARVSLGMPVRLVTQGYDLAGRVLAKAQVE